MGHPALGVMAHRLVNALGLNIFLGAIEVLSGNTIIPEPLTIHHQF